MKSGAVEFLTKPFRDQDLIDAIQAAIARDRAGALNLSEGRVKALRGQIMRKMQAETLPELVRIADRLGIAGGKESGPPK
jgi:FixJ family two-component response regulator